MTIRQIISNALLRLNVSQPNPSQLNKGKLAIERFWKEYSANGLINSDLEVITPTLVETDTNVYEVELEDVGAIVGLIDGKYTCKQVDIFTWYNHQNLKDYYALTQKENSCFTIYHRKVNDIKLIVRKQIEFELDDELTLPEELEPVLELYLCTELARSQEQYTRYKAEYDAKLLNVISNRATFVLPTRDLDDCVLSRRWEVEP